jgi:hypothetical protein
MENCRERQAAEKLADWFHLNGYKTAPSSSERGGGAPRAIPVKSPANIPEHSKPSDSGKGFMHETGLWLDEVLKVVPEDERQKVKKLIAARIYESYKNGKSAPTG